MNSYSLPTKICPRIADNFYNNLIVSWIHIFSSVQPEVGADRTIALEHFFIWLMLLHRYAEPCSHTRWMFYNQEYFFLSIHQIKPNVLRIANLDCDFLWDNQNWGSWFTWSCGNSGMSWRCW